MKVAIILGTKAELIKTVPVIKELEKRKIKVYFIHTGQHRLDYLYRDFGIKEPDYVLDEPPRLSSRFMTKTSKGFFWGLTLIPKIRKVLNKIKPDYVLYHGDTLSTASAAVASAFGTWRNGHLEAGLRSGSIWEPFPEEISRVIADFFSDFLFAPSELSAKHVEGNKGKVIMTGNTIVDSLLLSLKLAKKQKFPRIKGKYVVVNIHRHETIKSKDKMAAVIKIIKKANLPMYWPIHDNTKAQLEKFGLWDELRSLNIKFSPLMSYLEFVWMLSHCNYIITDGGSIQEESLYLKKPCIILRDRTERQEGLESGINFLVGFNKKLADDKIRVVESKHFKIKKFKNPYGDGTAAKKIVDVLCEYQ